MSFVTLTRDYIEFLNNLSESFSGLIPFPELLKESAIYLIKTIQYVFIYIVTFRWIHDFSLLPIVVPQLSTALVKEKFLEEIEKIITKLKDKDFDIIYLGQNGSNNKGTPIIDNIYHLDKSNICTGTHGLLIKNKNIDRIVEKLNYINTPIDHKIKDTGNDLIVLVIHPFIVEMTNEPSTIRNLDIENFYPVSSKYIY